ncbi:MAG TPA: protease complex subunit PrcB family protein [Verrucomicrobiae bacterium]|nr:protease complex subunit PrcB family protein [Verrucomicrobiae bacterium]
MKSGALILALIALFGCVAQTCADSEPLRELAAGEQCSIQVARHYVIQDAVSWSNIWRSIPPAPPPHKIDFAAETVIGVTMGKRSTSGYSVAIREVEATTNRLRITVTYQSPLPGSIQRPVITSPFHFVAIPKKYSEAEFHIQPVLSSVVGRGQINFSWADLGTNYFYTLQSSSSLDPASWLPVEGWLSPKRTNGWSTALSSVRARFFRLKAEISAP